MPSVARSWLKALELRNVQVWHNRGRLFYAPQTGLTESERRTLAIHKTQIIEELKRVPWEGDDANDLVAPRPRNEGSYLGSLRRRPWDYEVAIILPTFGPMDLLRMSLACWRNQTVSPYFVVINTGPYSDEDAGWDGPASSDCELHEIGCHGWRHSSQPVAAALDLGFAVTQTRLAILTHTDVYPKHDRVIEELIERCGPRRPVVGYQMSRRQGSDEWLHCVSHTLTICDMVCIRRIGARWNLLAVLEEDNEVEQLYFGWPDTETLFNRCLARNGITPIFLGHESNAPVYENDHIVHWRSMPSVRHYAGETFAGRYQGWEDWAEETSRLRRAAPLPPLPPEAYSEVAGEPAVE